MSNIAGAGKDIFGEGASWEADTIARRDKSERRAWTVAFVSLALAAAAVIGIAVLGPMHRVVPYVFAVDKSTGDVRLISAADDRVVTGYQDLTDKHFVDRYVVARESYYYPLLQYDYDTVLGMSADDVGRAYAAIYSGADPRDKKLGSRTEIKTEILSIQLAKDAIGNKAVIRFRKIGRRVQSDTPDPPAYFVATLSYVYKPSMTGSEQQLIQNPLGFKVTSYRVDPEITPSNVATDSAK